MRRILLTGLAVVALAAAGGCGDDRSDVERAVEDGVGDQLVFPDGSVLDLDVSPVYIGEVEQGCQEVDVDIDEIELSPHEFERDGPEEFALELRLIPAGCLGDPAP